MPGWHSAGGPSCLYLYAGCDPLRRLPSRHPPQAAVKRAERKQEGARHESFAALQLLHDPQVGPGWILNDSATAARTALQRASGRDKSAQMP